MEYVAFLRGINVGGHKSVKMADLRTAFEAMGFQNVRTVLASGNVVFGAARPASSEEATARIAQELQQTLGHAVSVTVRTMGDLRHLVDSDPFKDVTLTPDTRLYITFLSQPVKSRPDFAYESPEGDLTIRRISPGEVAGMVVLSSGHGTTELMALLDKQFGAAVTTRNWDTINKVMKARQLA